MQYYWNPDCKAMCISYLLIVLFQYLTVSGQQTIKRNCTSCAPPTGWGTWRMATRNALIGFSCCDIANKNICVCFNRNNDSSCGGYVPTKCRLRKIMYLQHALMVKNLGYWICKMFYKNNIFIFVMKESTLIEYILIPRDYKKRL